MKTMKKIKTLTALTAAFMLSLSCGIAFGSQAKAEEKTLLEEKLVALEKQLSDLLSDSDSISRKITELENDEQILTFKTGDGIPVYLFAKKILVHENIMPLLMDMKLSEDDSRINRRALAFLLKALSHNVMHTNDIRNREIIFYAPSRPILLDGRYINRYADLLCAQYNEKSYLIEQTPKDWTWPCPRLNKNVLYDGVANTILTIMSKKIIKSDLEAVHEFMIYYNERVTELFGRILNEDRISAIIKQVCHLIAKARKRNKWLNRKIPESAKLFIMVGASYPSSYLLTKTLKERGIVVADIQHGYITRTNHAYGYSDALMKSAELKKGTADYFLTYGDWWNDQILAPSEKVSIGNPYRSLCIEKFKSNSRNRILIVGCGVNTEQCILLTEKIGDMLPHYEVLFRPHPGEVQATNRLIHSRSSNIRLDPVKEIYESLAISNTVISEISTVLFEAIGVCEKIIVLDTEQSRYLLPENPFIKCRDVEDIIDVINSDRHVEYDDDKIWKQNWELNYKTFVTKAIGSLPK